MVSSIRNTEILLGKRKKIVSKSEKKNIKNCRNYLVAKTSIKKGEILNLSKISCKRTGSIGVSPMNFYKFLNKRAKKNLKKDEQF